MSNLFQTIGDTIFQTISTAFGTRAWWVPTNSNREFTGLVLYNDPAEKEKFSDVEFEIPKPYIEYPKYLFPYLEKSVYQGTDEIIRIDFTNQGIKSFNVYKVVPKYDGNTMIAYLNPIE